MNLQLWYQQAVKAGVHTYCGDNCEFLIYKGFKISKFPERYLIQNVRVNDFYDLPNEEETKTLVENGFIKGADMMSYERHKTRYKKYIKRLEKAYDDLAIFYKKLEVNPKFYEKRLRNCEDNILKYTDLLFFYGALILQYEQKYNVKLKFNKNE